MRDFYSSRADTLATREKLHALLALAPRKSGVVGAHLSAAWRVDFDKNRQKMYAARQFKTHNCYAIMHGFVSKNCTLQTPLVCNIH